MLPESASLLLRADIAFGEQHSDIDNETRRQTGAWIYFDKYKKTIKIPPSRIEPEFSASEANVLSVTPRGRGTSIACFM